MKRSGLSQRDHMILLCLSCLPKKILKLHGADNTTEFVLHELCSDRCFDFSKAAFFVDNPDFNCCKGVAGCCQTERYQHPDDAWHQDPEPFSSHMKQASFNNKVRDLHHESITKDVEKAVDDLASQLDIVQPIYYTWELKNGNRGVLIFEQGESDYEEVKKHLEHGLSLLGFCPIF